MTGQAQPAIAGSAMIRNLLLSPLLFTALAASSPPQEARPYTLVETAQRFARLQDAVNAIGDRDGTIRISPGRHADCAVQEAGRIAYVAEKPGSAIFEGAMCEDKATLVLRGRGSRVDGLVFLHANVPDGNGAGIRMEKGDLTVTETKFADGQCGILSANDPGSSISIDRSTFSGLGKHPDGSGAHALYIGEYGALKITRTRFERGTGGHYVKTRAPRIELTQSSFDDSQGRSTNYMIDLSIGASGRIVGNTFVQGANKENYSTLIAVSPEGRDNRSAGLVIEDNIVSLAPRARETAFVGNWSGEQLTIRGNRLDARISAHERR
jgi:hypothetical protein